MVRKAGFMGLFLFLVMIMPGYPVQAQTPQDTLNEYVSELQSNPNDNALREKIIKFAQTMNPKPAIPEEARKYFVQGGVLLQGAKDQQIYADAVNAYRQALLAAPWWGDAYYNCGLALELDGRFDDAENAFKLYIATNPGESEIRKAQDKIYEIPAKKELLEAEKAAEQQRKYEASPEGIAEKHHKADEEFIRNLNGAHYIVRLDNGGHNPGWAIDIEGNELIVKEGEYPGTTYEQLNAHEYTKNGRCLYAPGRDKEYVYRAIISDDGNSITWIGGGWGCDNKWIFDRVR